MTTLLASEKGLEPRTLGSGYVAPSEHISTLKDVPLYEWPSYYLDRVDISTLTDEAGLIIAVKPYSDSTVRFKVSASTGNDFDVDWGDGTAVETVTSDTYASHNYDYFSFAQQAPIDLNSATDELELLDHGYSDGAILAFYENSSASGLSNGRYYHVINSTANTFQLTTRRGGVTVVPLLNTETVSRSPLKQAKVKITTPGTLESLEIRAVTLEGQDYAGICYIYSKTIGMSALTLQRTHDSTTGNFALSFLEAVDIDNPQMPSFSALFEGFYNFRDASGIVEPPILTDFSNMFKDCPGIRTLPSNLSLNYASNTARMFWGNKALREVPRITSNLSDEATNMFWGTGITSLYMRMPFAQLIGGIFQSAPLLSSAELVTGYHEDTNMGSMFSGCNIKHASNVVISNVRSDANMIGMFDANKLLTHGRNVYASKAPPTYVGCYSLLVIPVSKGTDQSSSFSTCHSLEYVNTYGKLLSAEDYSLGHASFQNCLGLRSITMYQHQRKSYAFQGCINLLDVNIAIGPGTNNQYEYLFDGCQSLQSVPIKTFRRSIYSNMPNLTNTFQGCSSIFKVDADVDFQHSYPTGLEAVSAMFLSCFSIQKFTPKGYYGNVNLSYMKLSAQALNDAYASLLPETEGYVSQTLIIKKLEGVSSTTELGQIAITIDTDYAPLTGTTCTTGISSLVPETPEGYGIIGEPITAVIGTLVHSNSGSAALSGLESTTAINSFLGDTNELNIRNTPGRLTSDRSIALPKRYSFLD